MLISPQMNLIELIDLMGERTKLGQGTTRASAVEARELRELLVRDYPGMDTHDIEGGKWHAYCCAVDPDEQFHE